MRTALVAAVLLLTACATTFTPEGREVRVISPVVAQQCRHLGMVQSYRPPLGGGSLAAQVDVRNRVAAKGGNAMVVVDTNHDFNGGGEVVGDAYLCP